MNCTIAREILEEVELLVIADVKNWFTSAVNDDGGRCCDGSHLCKFVEHPVYLKEIQYKLMNMEYSTVAECKADINLLWSNFQYTWIVRWAPAVYNFSVELQRRFNRRWDEMLDQWCTCEFPVLNSNTCTICVSNVDFGLDLGQKNMRRDGEYRRLSIRIGDLTLYPSAYPRGPGLDEDFGSYVAYSNFSIVDEDGLPMCSDVGSIVDRMRGPISDHIMGELEFLQAVDIHGWFKDPRIPAVDDEDVDDVEYPMCFCRIIEKLYNSPFGFSSVNGILDAMNIVWSNCIRYHTRRGAVKREMRQLKKVFDCRCALVVHHLGNPLTRWQLGDDDGSWKEDKKLLTDGDHVTVSELISSLRAESFSCYTISVAMMLYEDNIGLCYVTSYVVDLAEFVAGYGRIENNLVEENVVDVEDVNEDVNEDVIEDVIEDVD